MAGGGGRPRQFGFTFLLFVPMLAYWGYDTFVRWYTRKERNYDNVDTASHETTNPTDCGDESLTDNTKEKESQPLTANDFRQAFVNIEQGILNSTNCLVLLSLLRSADTDKIRDGLRLVLKLSVSSVENKRLLFTNKVTGELRRIVHSHQDLPEEVIALAINAVNNLSLNEDEQSPFTSLIGQLMDLSAGEKNSLAVASLQCLTNLSVMDTNHVNFTKVIHSLYHLLDVHSNRRLYVCRLLVNLSSNKSIVPHLLAAKKPSCWLQLITGEADISLRWLRFLTNISETVLSDQVMETALPIEYKAASPETMYSLLYGPTTHSQLSDSLLQQKTNSHEEINQLSNSLYKNINLWLLSVTSRSYESDQKIRFRNLIRNPQHSVHSSNSSSLESEFTQKSTDF